MTSPRYDVFISYASEDREAVARPLVQRLKEAGLRVWFDEDEIQIGESLRKAIDAGLSSSRFVVVIASETFFAKHWGQDEYGAAAAACKEVFPVLYGITQTELADYSPLLGGKKCVSTEVGLETVARKIVHRVSTANPWSFLVGAFNADAKDRVPVASPFFGGTGIQDLLSDSF